MPINKLKTYQDCIRYLYDLERAGIKYDLRNIKLLLKFSGNPQNEFKSIHIAGTNGKGTVSSIINSYLIESGYKTGLYTSPHIRDFRERILVNGKFISKKFIVEYTNKTHAVIEKIKPSFFEVTTGMAFDYFRFENVQYAVVETGLGGRLDSTNILKPVLTVITSLSIDHTDFLGKKIEKITREKGGIIKKNVPVTVGIVPEISERILKRIARDNKSEIIFTSKIPKLRIKKRMESGFYFDVSSIFKNLFFPVTGDYQLQNINTFLASLESLYKTEKLKTGKTEIKNAFRNLKLNSNYYGRFNLISSKPKIVVDVSHNLQSIMNIRNNLKYFKFNKLVLIFGMMQDKNYSECLEEIGKLKGKIILTKPDYKRAAEPEKLYATVKKNKNRFVIKNNLSEALKYSKEITDKNDLILVTGSFFLVSDFLKIVHRK